MEVPVGEVQQRFAEAMAAAERGETVVFTQEGAAIFQLVPTHGSHPTRIPSPEEAAETKKVLGFAPDEDVWPAEFDEPSLSRQALGLE